MSRLLVLNRSNKQLVDAFTKQPIDNELQADDCVYFPDGFDFIAFDILKATQQTIPKFLVSEGGIVAGDVVNNYQMLFIPDLKYGIQNLIRKFIHEKMPIVDDYTTKYSFNFSVNIYRVDRILMMKLISWFGLFDYQYSWRGDGVNCDMSPVLKEMRKITQPWLTKQLKNHILAPVTEFEPRWIEINKVPIVHKWGTSPGARVDSINDIWPTAVKPLMEQSAVTLICESSNRPEIPACHFSEKTMFSMLAATFPIWIGTYGQADQTAEMGFDIFPDVIDHSYQYYDTVLERCYYAIHDNIGILNDVECARELRKRHWHRLQNNQNLLVKKNLLGKYAVQQAKKLPLDIQEKLIFTDDSCTFPSNNIGS